MQLVFDYDSPDDNPTKLEGTAGPGDSGGRALIEQDGKYLVAVIGSMGQPGKNGPATYGAIEHYVRVSQFCDWSDASIANPDPNLAYVGKSNSPEEDTGRRVARNVEVPMNIEVNTTGSGQLSDTAQAKTGEDVCCHKPRRITY